MLIRPIEQEDAAAIARIWYDGWRDAHLDIVPAELTEQRTLDSFAQRLSKAFDVVRVCIDGAKPLGFSMIKQNEIDQFYVAAHSRGKGVARHLMIDAETQIKSVGFDSAWLACSIGNTRAARFYEKSGWTNVGVKPMTFEATNGPFPLDVWIFEKTFR